MKKLKIHLLTLPRWFALPWFGGCALIGSVIAGGTLGELNTWLAFISVALLMASGHSQNSYIDWAVGLDSKDGSVEKGYTGGCGVIPGGLLSPAEVVFNFIALAAAGLAVCGVIAARVNPYVFVPAVLSLAVPYFYTKGKFSWYHETALASGIVLGTIQGMLAVNPNAEWWRGILVALPPAIVLCYLGLAFDEYLDAEANLGKGVKSLAYKVWEYRFDLSLYILCWLVALYILQLFLITIGVLKPLTMISLIDFPAIVAVLVFLKPWADDVRKCADYFPSPVKTYKRNKAIQGFNKVGRVLVLIGMTYPLLILLGQAI